MRSVLRDGVYHTLRNRITSGQIPPGASLREKKLADEFKVSRTPVREAIRKLAEEGFLEYIPHCGGRLLDITPEIVREVFLIREALEGVAAREAAERITDEGMAALRERLEVLRPRVAQGDVSDVGDFIHAAMFSACGNRRLAQLMSVCHGHVEWIQTVAVQVPGRLQRSFREHESILSALETRDPELSERSVRAHVRSTLNDILAALASPGAPPGAELRTEVVCK